MIHHLKIYPEHFSAVCTGVKRAELRKNDRDFKVGDTLHLMETPKGSCSPTGEYINAVVTHIADVGEWLPGYVMLSIERESGYAAPQLPQPAVMTTDYSRFLSDVMTAAGLLSHGKRDKALATSLSEYCVAERMRMDAPCRAAPLQGAEPVSQPYTLRDGWVAVPVEPTEDMIIAGFEAELREEFRAPEAWEAFEAMSGCEQAALRAKWCWAAMITAAPRKEAE